MIGIVGYGVYIPRFRLPLADIAQAWGREPQEILQGLQIQTKAVPAVDEDAVTLAVEAGRRALVNTHLSAKDVQSIFVGSESHPYTVNPSATKVAAFLGMGQSYFAADMEFACKAGTTAMQVTMGLLAADSIRYGMAIGSDTAQSRPRDVLEYTAGCGAASLVLGKKKEEVIAEILDTASYASNTPDFWRREGEKYPSHVGRFSGEPGYFAHILAVSDTLLKKTSLQPKDFAYCVFHMPNGKFPKVVAKKLGFTSQQLAPSLVVETIGNPYSASSLIGLASVLDTAKPGEKIFFASYGSGAGADGFVFEVTPAMKKYQQKAVYTVAIELQDTVQIDYLKYLQQTSALS